MSTIILTERDWQRQVIELAQLHRWRVAHFRPAQTKDGWRTPVEADGKGFPDLVLVRIPGELIFAELKSDTGRLSDDQTIWLDLLRLVRGIDVYVWRPRDFDEVERRLRR